MPSTFLILPFVLFLAANSPIDEGIFNVKPMHLSSLNAGARLYIALEGQAMDPIEPEEKISISRDGKEAIISKMSDLLGAVNIATQQQALEFVRLRTSPSTWRFWPTPEAEIVDRHDGSYLPNYAIPISISFADWRAMASGGIGILSPPAYQAGHFQHASVIPKAGGFLVTRWLLVQSGTRKQEQLWVEKVQETVGKKGSYSRVVLKKSRAANWQGVDLGFPYFGWQ